MGVVNEKYDRLSAGADPENQASQKVLLKAGFVKGELRKGVYQRASKSVVGDLQYFYFERAKASGV